MDLTTAGAGGTIRCALAPVGLLVLTAALLVAGCTTTPCDDLEDAAAEAGCATVDPEAPSVACEGEAEDRARCWLENVIDVCSPSVADLRAVDACLSR